MSPTVFRKSGFRFYFFSREEPRMHIHVHGQAGEAKFWMDPYITLAQSYGFSGRELNVIRKMIEDHKDEIRKAWRAHFGS